MVRVKIQYIVALVLFAELVNSTGAQEAPWYVEPLWYARIEAEDETGLLMRCIEEELNGPPKHGDLCTSAPAVCYFGTQDCDGVGAHPEIMCVCDGGAMWQCDEEKMACPPFPDPARTGCAAPGEKIDHGNAAVCPEEDQGIFNLGYLLNEEYAAGTCGEPGTTCYYGSDNCCGTCFAFTECDSCDTLDGWHCVPRMFCYFRGSCSYEAEIGASPFDAVIGGSCIEARTVIFAVYPGMNVTCQAESDPRPTARDPTRYIVLLDDETAAVTSVHFDMPPITSCPTDPVSGTFCDFDGGECPKPAVTVDTGTELCTTGPSICRCARELSDGSGFLELQCYPPFQGESCVAYSVTSSPEAPSAPLAPSGSSFPSDVPSSFPSGSFAPSSMPSGSFFPSSVPSFVPSALPSGSSLPSTTPSGKPSGSSFPSNSPSGSSVPSSAPTGLPPPKATSSPTITEDFQNSWSLCFSERNKVLSKARGLIPISEVAIGDYVLAAGNKFELVYSLAHSAPSKKANFIRLTTTAAASHNRSTTAPPLELSPDHMVLTGNRKVVTAKSVQPGAFLLLADGSSAQVLSTELVSSKGLFAPFTTSGTLVVNGIVASSYIDVLELSWISGHWLAHTYQTPHRVLCHWKLDWCMMSETYSQDGVSRWVDKPLCSLRWVSRQHPILKGCAYGIIIVLLSLFGVFVESINISIDFSIVLAFFLVASSGVVLLKNGKWTITLKSTKASSGDAGACATA